MVNSKRTMVKKVNVVKQTNVPATLRQIPPGSTAMFSREDLGSEITVRSAISRENAKCKRAEFMLKVLDFGKKYEITRY